MAERDSIAGHVPATSPLSPRAAFDRLSPLIRPLVRYTPSDAWEADTQGLPRPLADYRRRVRAFAEQIRPFVPRPYTVLGTDGFGRSDTREKLRHFFEVDRHWITLAAMTALADEGAVKREKLAEAIKKYGLDPNKPNPVKV